MGGLSGSYRVVSSPGKPQFKDHGKESTLNDREYTLDFTLVQVRRSFL